MDKQKSYQVIRHFVDGVIPAKYKEVVERWLVSGRDAETKDEAMLRVWDETPAEAVPGLSDSLNEFRRRRRAYSLMSRRSYIIGRVMRYAAVLLLPLIAGVAIWMYSSQWNGSEEMMACSVPYGMTKTVQLSDGTSVIVNAGSTLSYPREFKGAYRRLSLSGEAHFAVAKDASHPFIVKVGRLSVQVLGTHFNIKAYSDDQVVATTLEEGAVKLYVDERTAQACFLRPNEQAIYHKNDGRMTKSKVDAAAYCSWTEGSLTFENQSLDQILPALKRRYGVNFSIDPQLDMKKVFTMNFKSYETIDDVLTVLSQLDGDMSYRREGKVVKLIKGEKDVGR
jgi:ferric-dicitrate binding protein FerR (iron transport regulator)